MTLTCQRPKFEHFRQGALFSFRLPPTLTRIIEAIAAMVTISDVPNDTRRPSASSDAHHPTAASADLLCWPVTDDQEVWAAAV
jgi:hypothetical protein